jgi:hypothetical protein
VARFTPKVLRLLSVYVTDVVIREIDALFGTTTSDWGLNSQTPAIRASAGSGCAAT